MCYCSETYTRMLIIDYANKAYAVLMIIVMKGNFATN